MNIIHIIYKYINYTYDWVPPTKILIGSIPNPNPFNLSYLISILVTIAFRCGKQKVYLQWLKQKEKNFLTQEMWSWRIWFSG